MKTIEQVLEYLDHEIEADQRMAILHPSFDNRDLDAAIKAHKRLKEFILEGSNEQG